MSACSCRAPFKSFCKTQVSSCSHCVVSCACLQTRPKIPETNRSYDRRLHSRAPGDCRRRCHVCIHLQVMQSALVFVVARHTLRNSQTLFCLQSETVCLEKPVFAPDRSSKADRCDEPYNSCSPLKLCSLCTPLKLVDIRSLKCLCPGQQPCKSTLGLNPPQCHHHP